MTRSSHVQVIIVQTRFGIVAIHKPASNKNFEKSYLRLHYRDILEYISLWSEVQFLKIQKSTKIQEIQKPN